MRFYKVAIDKKVNKKNAYAFPTFGYPTEEIVCEICDRRWKNFNCIYTKKIPFPISFINSNFSDFISCEALILVSEKVKNFMDSKKINLAYFTELPVFSKSELTNEHVKYIKNKGYDVKKIFDGKPKYYMLDAEITAELHEDSNVEWVDSGPYVCKHCGYGIGYQQKDFFAPYYIKKESWNGSDLFKVKEFLGTLFCTQNYKIMCESQEYTGITFEEIPSK